MANLKHHLQPWARTPITPLPDVKNISDIRCNPEAVFWKEQDAIRGKFDAWVKEVETMLPKEQVKAIAAELQRRNPKFDVNTLTATFAKTGEVIALKINTDAVSDISPVRAVPKLKTLEIAGKRAPRRQSVRSLGIARATVDGSELS